MQNFDFFGVLSRDEVEALKAKSKLVRLQKGAVLFYEGEICNEILYLLQGKIRLCVSGEGTSEIPLYDFCGGEQCVVNIASAISQTPAVATAEAITDISGWLIPASVIQELIVRNKEYQKMIFSLFTLRYGALTTLIEDIKFKRLDSRILDLLRSFGTDEITIKNAEIAERLGTSRNVINRVL
ncbi:MAG: Crp/Fnr family transcriptional regulator [Campylobacter gracilis]|uniref:Crp/Fnr family transcriptional regulator n=1 Tax=Campylobacter gracilis TaxID=824 RepID=UPI0026EE69C5|nr:Crp/Fnr family transcriptional regulator [Campylobacter gracilis]MBS6152317.1 Crp/Fnr family transcriptional regulator [Campylobacter gracilis]